MKLKFEGESELTGRQVEEGHSAERTVCLKTQRASERPGAFRDQAPICVAGALGEPQGKARPDHEEPCVPTEG